MLIARLFTISGLVQGVGYRYFAQRSAAKHQVSGYVKNLENGSVEALAQGDEKAVSAFRDDLAAGPYHAKVNIIEELVAETDKANLTFKIER